MNKMRISLMMLLFSTVFLFHQVYCQSVITPILDTFNVRGVRDTVIIRCADSSYVFIRNNFSTFDRILNSTPTMPFESYANFSRFFFTTGYLNYSLGTGAFQNFLFKPPSDTSDYRIYAFVDVNGDLGHYSWTLEIDPDSVSVSGTQIVCANFDREFPQLSRMTAYINPTYHDNDSIVLTPGMAPQSGPLTSANPFSQGLRFFKLNPSKFYIFKCKNRGAQTASFHITFYWYEFIPTDNVKY